ncbi:MAG TPA: alkaline phosphatase family protein [Thermoanaerobaculia bacterium]|nr:alkaline phosphatase family protein [Thermoanaerobaculia bacterium]
MLRTVRRRQVATSGLTLFLAAVAMLAGCRRVQEKADSSAAAAAAPPPQSVPVESADVGERAPRLEASPRAVIWIGLDGLDWEILDRLAAEGKMPNWSRLVAEGYSGRLTAFMPILSPILWTTAATGVGPDVHRILDFQEVDPGTGQKVPISGLSRAVPAIWNLASAAGETVGVVGWWATHPAEEVRGFFVTDHASPILYEKLTLSGAAYPPALESGVAQILSRDGKVAAADLAPFLEAPPAEVTAALASGEGMENRFVALARILAATRVYHRIARELYDKNHPDLMMLYLEGTDEIGHVFAPVSPPRLACVSEEDFARFRGAAAAYYALVDRVLGQWMRRAAEDHATLLVHSDHGFKWGDDRSCGRSSLGWSTAAFWHRPDGVFAAWGAGVRPGKASSKASMFDVAPTVLSLLGLPRDRKMTGHPIAAAFDSLPDAGRKDWSAAVTVRRVAAAAMSPAETAEYTKKLLALGYLSGSESKALAPPGGDRPGMTEGAWNNLGLYERETVKNAASARAAFEKSLALSPSYHSPMFNLAILYRDQGEDARAREWLYRSFAAGHAEPEATLAVWVRWYQENRPAGLKALLDEAVRHYPDSEPLARELAIERFRGKDCAGGYAVLAPFEMKTSDPDTLNSLALLQTCLGRREEAIALLERSLAIKPGQPGTIRSLEFLKRSHPPNG